MASLHGGFSGGGTSGTSNRTATGTPSVGDLLVVGCVVANNSNTSPTCSDDQGGTYDLVDAALFASSLGVLSVFVRKQRVSSAVSHVITVATGPNDAGIVGVAQIQDMGKVGIAAVRQSAKQQNQASGGTPAPAFSSSALSRNLTLGWVGNQTNPATMSPPINFTEQADLGQTSPSTGQEFVSNSSSFTGTTVTWGSTSGSAFGSMIVEFETSDEATTSATLGAITGSAAADVEMRATSSATLGAITGSVAAAATCSAISSETLGAITGSIAAAVSNDITSNKALGAITGSMVATLLDHASSAATLGPITGSATAELGRVLTSDLTLGRIAGSLAVITTVSARSDLQLTEITGFMEAIHGAPAAPGLPVPPGFVAAGAMDCFYE